MLFSIAFPCYPLAPSTHRLSPCFFRWSIARSANIHRVCAQGTSPRCPHRPRREQR
jgi:hypothetical protein